jgi:hypothetical protein
MRLSLAFLVFASFTTAAEPPKAALTQKEIDEGWIQLFDGESLFGWKTEGEVKFLNGKLTIAPDAAMTYAVPLPKGTILIEETGGLSVKMPAGGDKPVVVKRLPTDHEIIRINYMPEKPYSLFNGENFSGWKVHDEPKKNSSKFEVTKDGELRVTNGPGDLQTTGKYADFLLQFQCKTNGDGLNSGIFFRCIEGQYQNGYECQIQNAMVDNDPAKPKDFGTGAIYRRTPARKIVAKDKEWFSVTLVAHGDQFASWVNGYPVMKWKDERPADENPRKGLRKAAGHLSIQGHDPTTDILFRKLNVVVFK